MNTKETLLVQIDRNDIETGGEYGQTLWGALNIMLYNLMLPSPLRDITPQSDEEAADSGVSVLRVDWLDLRWKYYTNDNKTSFEMVEEASDTDRALWFFVRDLFESIEGILQAHGVNPDDVTVVEIDMVHRSGD